ncbi:diguanylate cyclase [Edwardsiella hoshinae]|uniref:Cyclic di-GMP phosphodiesterase YfgF n=1 Tax=Edwardsiella hoshinae TaxID=93378 RepID=A0A376DHY4_9GAMM|nr:EAL domain-containing protein [Edwardsiella hoshinae]AOV97415.1 diguanylate cyclase [Edwardsiella hoshinae]QPR26645.1 EAL domain-containing protein [Edwardsiella hoshinae]STC89828.1 Cyclic di-GMP phosphodiesterase YfgF [Edwardsiella hoshinae]
MKRIALSGGKYALPGLLSMLLLPLAEGLSPLASVNGEPCYLLYLPLALNAALLLLFAQRALLTLALSLPLYSWLFSSLPVGDILIQSLALLLPLWVFLVLSQRWQGVRWRCDIHRMSARGIALRLLGLGLLYPLLSGALMLSAGVLPALMPAEPLQLPTILLSLAGMVLSGLVLTPAGYILLRVLLSQGYRRAFVEECRRALHLRHGRRIVLVLLLSYLTLMGALCLPSAVHVNVSYLTPLLFILFTLAAFHVSDRLLWLLWALSIMLLLASSQHFIWHSNRHYQLAFLSSSLIAFSISLLFTLLVIKKNRLMRRFPLRLLGSDFPPALPTLCALNRHLQRRPRGTLCLLHLGNLEILGRCHGMTMRTLTKNQLATLLAPSLLPGERVYQLQGAELLVYLQPGAEWARIDALHALLLHQPLHWQRQPVAIQYGVAYAAFDAHRHALNARIGQLSYLAERSCQEHRIMPLLGLENEVSLAVNEQVFWLQKITRALQENTLLLYAQPIVHRGGKCYYEILTRLQDGGQLILPGKFIPFITAFNLCAQFDLLIIENVLRHICRAKLDSTSTCFSVNLMPSTLMQHGVAAQIIALFERYQVRPEAVIFEITEQQYLLDENRESETVRALRAYNFKIAIDDFGTGLSNYQRLKHLHADVVKIDGMFVKDIVSNSLDRLIIKSICDIAREKQLQVVAEYVESREQMEVLCSLGVQYLQGFLLGKPRPLAS